MILRQVHCDIPGCGKSYTEPKPGEGWAGWGSLQGIALNGIENPLLCPEHLSAVAEFTASLDKK